MHNLLAKLSMQINRTWKNLYLSSAKCENFYVAVLQGCTDQTAIFVSFQCSFRYQGLRYFDLCQTAVWRVGNFQGYLLADESSRIVKHQPASMIKLKPTKYHLKNC